MRLVRDLFGMNPDFHSSENWATHRTLTSQGQYRSLAWFGRSIFLIACRLAQLRHY